MIDMAKVAILLLGSGAFTYLIAMVLDAFTYDSDVPRVLAAVAIVEWALSAVFGAVALAKYIERFQ